MKKLDLAGQTFGRLIALERVSGSQWKCLCKCGNKIIAIGTRLKSGRIKSCGCLMIDNRQILHQSNITHGKSNTLEYRLWIRAFYRAKRHGLPFSITLEDMPHVPSFCPVLGIPIAKARKKPSDNSPSLDRIIRPLGYVKGNVRIVSQRANRIRNDATASELFLIARDQAEIEGYPNVQSKRGHGMSP